MPEISNRDILSEELCKSQFAGDLLDAIRTRREGISVRTADVREFRTSGPISVIIEANARIPGGAARARAELVRLYLKQKDPTELSASQPRLLAALSIVQSLGFRIDESQIDSDVKFQQDDQLDLRNSF